MSQSFSSYFIQTNCFDFVIVKDLIKSATNPRKVLRGHGPLKSSPGDIRQTSFV